MLGLYHLARSLPFAAALSIAALGALSAGCGKEQSPGAGTESPGKDPQAAQDPGKASPETARPSEAQANAASTGSPAAPSTGDSRGAQQPAANEQGVQAKGDPGRIAAPSRPDTQAPAAEPAAPTPPSTAGDARPAEPPAPAPTSAAGDARTAEVTSPKVGEANFSVWMQSSGKHKVGQPGVVEVVLIPKNGFKCNENYPYKIKLNDAAGVSFPQPVVRKEGMSVSPQRGVMRVPFVPSAAGDARIAGKFSFSVCTSDQCLIDSRDLAITVKVE
jgi:hypothetical protein